ncbi:MAG: hypothetical protein AVDCRST_MAG14-588, partial [uncultured Rubrobacteraceae bacterium]
RATTDRCLRARGGPGLERGCSRALPRALPGSRRPPCEVRLCCGGHGRGRLRDHPPRSPLREAEEGRGGGPV